MTVPKLDELAERLLIRCLGAADGQHDPVRSEVPDLDPVAVVVCIGHERLDHEAPAGGEDSRHVAHHQRLPVGIAHTEKGVYRDENQPERAFRERICHVCDVTGDPVATRLCRQPIEHSRRSVERVHLEADLGEGDREAPGSRPELEHACAAGQRSESLHAGTGVRGRGVPVVVDLGHSLAVAGFVVPAHAQQ
uniref:Unannotated protein n=1 Tax=freshwater metagenome TaxID=449393 RepID=A0A6J7PN93_9ZZZZ